ncbi:MAG: BCSC C-terminal domain-containing protein [Akkermansiaceae bacterium]|nr:BCSC C-terminal domain-containing protein [Verrucomicrobiae bacterium]MCP5554794.1 BCSC C-terminal domain-containing protein [Akkermansiaceae bacterium]
MSGHPKIVIHRSLGAAVMGVVWAFSLHTGRVCAQVQKYQDAEIPNQAPTTSTNESSEDLSRMAWNQYDAGEYVQARDQFKSLLAKDPADSAAARGLILSTYRAGDPVEAYALARAHEADIPNARGVVLGMVEGDAWKLVDSKEYKKADDLIGGFKDEPSLGKVREEIGRHEVEQALIAGRSNEAVTLAEGYGLDSQKLSSTQSRLLVAKAEQLQASGKYRESLKVLEEADDISSLDRGAQKLKAWGLYHTRQFKGSAELFESLYRQIPERDMAEGLTYSLQQSGRVSDLAHKSEELGGAMKTTAQPVTDAIVERERLRQDDLKKQQAANELGHVVTTSPASGGSTVFVHPEGALDRSWSATGSAPLAAVNPGQFNRGGRHLMAGTSRMALGSGFRVKQGDSGTSQLTAMELPALEGEMVFGPNGNQSLGLSVRRHTLDTGSVNLNHFYGSAPTGGRLVKVAPVTRVDTLVEPRLSYRREEGNLGFFAELGTTPIGGSVSALPVGAIGIDWKQPEYHWRAEVFSESVTESMLSWVGAKDPYTGNDWGRVTETGVRAEGWHQLSGPWGVYGDVKASYLGGEGVADNSSFAGTVALSYNLDVDGFEYFSIGPSVHYEHYDKNLSQFTHGHGGYFSPDSMLQAMMGVSFQTESGHPWMMEGFVGGGWQTNDQASAAVLPLSPDGRYYDSLSDSSAVFTARLQGTWALAPQWQVGAQAGYAKTASYEEYGGALFLRYLMSPTASIDRGDLYRR